MRKCEKPKPLFPSPRAISNLNSSLFFVYMIVLSCLLIIKGQSYREKKSSKCKKSINFKSEYFQRGTELWHEPNINRQSITRALIRYVISQYLTGFGAFIQKNNQGGQFFKAKYLHNGSIDLIGNGVIRKRTLRFITLVSLCNVQRADFSVKRLRLFSHKGAAPPYNSCLSRLVNSP